MLHDISTLRGPTCYVYPQQRREEELRVAVEGGRGGAGDLLRLLL